MEQIASLTERIRGYDRRLEAISLERYPETELLRQVEGIGSLTALAFVLTVENPHRFEKSRCVGAYLGLVPATERSGERDLQKRISKEGEEMLRRVLVGSAHYILGPFGSAEIALRISSMRRLRKRTWCTLEHEQRALRRLQRLGRARIKTDLIKCTEPPRRAGSLRVPIEA